MGLASRGKKKSMTEIVMNQIKLLRRRQSAVEMQWFEATTVKKPSVRQLLQMCKEVVQAESVVLWVAVEQDGIPGTQILSRRHIVCGPKEETIAKMSPLVQPIFSAVLSTDES